MATKDLIPGPLTLLLQQLPSAFDALDAGPSFLTAGATWTPSDVLTDEVAGKHLSIGYDSANSIGYIRSVNSGTAFTPLHLAGSETSLWSTTGAGDAVKTLIASEGNVGITGRLSVTGHLSNEVLSLQARTDFANVGSYAKFYTSNPNYWWEIWNADAADGSSTNDLRFRSRQAAAAIEYLTLIGASGFIGIGTALPLVRLHAAGKFIGEGDGSGNSAFADFGKLNTVGSGEIGLQLGRSGLTSGVAIIQGAKEGVGVNNLALQPSGGSVGIGTTTVSAKLHSLATTEQLRLGYDAANYASFTTSIVGDLTIAPSGGDTIITGTLGLSGQLTLSGGLVVGTELFGLVPATHLAQFVATGSVNPMMIAGGTATVQIWKDDTASKAVAFGMNLPGLSGGNDFVFSTWNGTTWTEGVRISNSGGGVTVSTSLTTPLILSPGNLTITPGGTLVSIASTARLQSSNYASQTTGWAADGPTGAGDFRYLYADEMHVRSFIADIEFALAGGQIIAKSTTRVAADWTLPAAGASTNFTVEEFSGSTAHVFVDGDLVWVKQTTRGADTSLTHASAYGTVTYVSRTAASGTTPSFQTYTFARPASNGGSATGTINKGTMAIDFGTSANKWGYWEVNAVDGANALNSPYAQVVTASGVGGPAVQANRTVRTRIGNLNGITGVQEYGLYAGNVIDGATLGVTDKYLRVTDTNFDIHNIGLQIYESSTKVIELNQAGPYFALGNPMPTSFLQASSEGIWMGKSGSDYNMRVGVVNSSGVLTKGWKWDAGVDTLTVVGTINADAGSIGGWTINSTDIRNAAASVMLRGAGNLAFGTTPPTSASSGTGLFQDGTGMYGLLSNVVQAKFDAATGAITAGASKVVLDSDGIAIDVGDQSVNQLKWMNGASVSGMLGAEIVGSLISTIWTANASAAGFGHSLIRTMNGSSGEVDFEIINTGNGGVGNAWANLVGQGGCPFEGLLIAKTGGASPAPALEVILELRSTTSAFLPTRMTTAQRDALTAIDGMILYNSTTGALNYRKAGAWVAI